MTDETAADEAKAYTVRELIAALSALVEDDPSVADLEVAYDTGAAEPDFLQGGVTVVETDAEDREESGEDPLPDRYVEIF